MNEETAAALNALNRRFYAERADEFNQTRERAWKGWTELFDRCGEHIETSPRVLDVGCGNGRFARFLIGRGLTFEYDGVDASRLGLDHARSRLDPSLPVRLHEHDVIAARTSLPESLMNDTFDLIVLFGLLHHVPGRHHRRRLMRELAGVLAPGGVLAYTVWKFDRFERFRKKLVPWDAVDAPIDPGELEPGDCVMTWGGTSPAHRYCHALSDDEARAISDAVPLERLATFSGDSDLNDYWVLVKKAPGDRREPA